MVATIAVLAACMLVVAGILLRWSPGKPAPLVDEHGNPLAGSISEKIRVNINGAEQGMFIESKDATKPVLLFVHGGSGMPERFLAQIYGAGLPACSLT